MCFSRRFRCEIFRIRFFFFLFLSFPSRPFNVFKNEHLPELHLSSLRPYYIVVLKSGGI